MHLLNNIKYMLALRNNWKYTIWCVACDRRSCSCNKNRMAYRGIDTSTTATRVNSKLKRLLTKQLIKFVLLRSGIDWNPSMRYDNKIKMFLFSFGAFGCVARSLRSSVFWVRLVSLVPHHTHSHLISALFTCLIFKILLNNFAFQYEMCTLIIIIAWVHWGWRGVEIHNVKC